MMDIVRAHERYHFEMDRLSTYWHFSFDHYYDPKNVGFGPLRVFNDDTVRPGGGFPAHSHREMEIVTIPLAGRLEHRDSEGHHGIIGPGDVQRMSAGTGISHSEFNASRAEPVHFLQIWILPARRGLKPSYEQKSFPLEARRGVLLPVASGEESLTRGHDLVRIYQDATFFLATVRPEDHVEHQLRPGRRAYVFVVSGALDLNGSRLESGDVGKVTEETALTFRAGNPSEVLMIDLP